MTHVVVRIQFRSVACPPKGDGKLLPKVMRFYTRRAPFGSLFSRRGRTGILNFCRYLTGWSFGALAQACKQSSRRFADSFSRLLGFVGFHANQPKRRQKVWRTQIKGIRNP